MWNGVCLCEYLDDWEKFNEKLLTEKDDFYSHFNMEDITDADYGLTKIVWDFEIKNFRKISWSAYSKWYLIVRWCISGL